MLAHARAAKRSHEESPLTQQRSVRQLRDPPGGGQFEGAWANCAAALQAAVEVAPFGDIPDAVLDGDTMKSALSVQQLLAWGDRMLRGSDREPPEESVFVRWASHTLTALARANRSRTTLELRCLADELENGPPDEVLLPAHLLRRHGPNALLQQLATLPATEVAYDLSTLPNHMRDAAELRSVADRVPAWRHLLAALADETPVEQVAAARPRAPPALNGRGGLSCHVSGLAAEVDVSSQPGPSGVGGQEERHWQIRARVRCVAREPRAVRRLVLAEEVPPCAFALPPAASPRATPTVDANATSSWAGARASTAMSATELLRSICTREVVFEPPLKLAGARGLFGGGGRLEYAWKAHGEAAGGAKPKFVIASIEVE